MEETNEITIESLAQEAGWRPDFEGEGAKTAAEFLRHGQTINKKQTGTIKGQNDKIEELKTATSKMSEMMADMQTSFNKTVETQTAQHNAELDRQRQELEEKRNNAIDEADRSEVNKIDKQIKDIDSQKKEAETTQSNVTSEAEKYAKKWENDNAWLRTDTKASKEFWKAVSAHRIDVGGVPDTLEGVKAETQAAEEHLKKLFPEQYGLKPEEEPPGGAVGEGNTKTPEAKTKLSVKDLTAEEKSEYDDYKRHMGKNFNSETMLKNINNLRIGS